MPCYHQQLAVPMPGKTKNGKTPYKFIGKARDYYTRYRSISGLKFMPCRQCIGCHLEKSRQWATRLVHEEPFHPGAVFLTLTYDDSSMPFSPSGIPSLFPSHWEKFIDNLRDRSAYHYDQTIKYFGVGEYASPNEKTPTGRPHYHAVIFGPVSIYGDDHRRHEEEPSRGGDPQWSHDDFAAVWPHGRHRFSEFNFETAAYVARYILKKAAGIYQEATIGDRALEFKRQSQGLGRRHFEKWRGDIFPGDKVVLRNRGSFMPPPYYDRLLEKVDPVLFEKVKLARKEAKEIISTSEDFLEHVSERTREGEVRKLVTDQTLIRGFIE